MASENLNVFYDTLGCFLKLDSVRNSLKFTDNLLSKKKKNSQMSFKFIFKWVSLDASQQLWHLSGERF